MAKNAAKPASPARMKSSALLNAHVVYSGDNNMSTQRKHFYEVNKDAYLFPSQLKKGTNRVQREEPVRQWCAYELIRAYGIDILDMTFEHPVRVGSKKYHIDILVSRRGAPWLVVECKESGHKKHDEGMEQAVSYASAQEIQAEFAVYTNGQVWHVKRRIRDQWIAVPDFPHQNTPSGGEQIFELLNCLHKAAPLLYKLDERLEDKEATKFLSVMQMFFNGVNLLTKDADRDLIFATDLLLRVLSSANGPPDYRIGTLEAARQKFESYRKPRNLGFEIRPVMIEREVASEMPPLCAALQAMIEGAKGLAHCDILLLRLDMALSNYGSRQHVSTKLYPEIESSVHQALWDFLTHAFARHLNVSLPERTDKGDIDEMKSFCRFAWDSSLAKE